MVVFPLVFTVALATTTSKMRDRYSSLNDILCEADGRMNGV